MKLFYGLLRCCEKIIKNKNRPDLEKKPKVILLVAHAASLNKAQAQFCDFEQQARACFPAHLAYWVFTGAKQAHTVFGREQYFSLTEALTQVKNNGGCTQILVQPLYIVPGQEFKQLQQEVQGFLNLNESLQISLGKPLLSSACEVKMFARQLVAQHSNLLSSSQAVVYVAHGSNDLDAKTSYDLLEEELRGLNKKFFFTSLLDQANINLTIKQLQQANCSSVQFIPLMTNPGRKTLGEIVGGNNSLSAKLMSVGISCTAHLQGLIKNKSAQTLWLAHLQKANDRINPGV